MQQEKQQTASDGIGLRDIVNYIKRNYGLFVFGGFAGLLLSTAFVLLVPNKYEARWQIQMAQFIVSNSNSNSEEPAALIQRLRTPTTYTVEVQQSCGVQPGVDIGDFLGGKLTVGVVKNVSSSVEMKIRASSPEQARQCAEAIIAMVGAQQRSLIEERLAGRQEQLMQYQQAMKAEQLQLKMIKKTELGNFGYLAKLDKLSWLRSRIDALQEEALMSQLHPARLLAPIHVLSRPVSPKVGLLLALGVFLGLMLGVLYAMGRDLWRKAA